MNITALSSSLQCCCTCGTPRTNLNLQDLSLSPHAESAERLLAVLSHAAAHKHRLLHPTDTCRCQERIDAEALGTATIVLTIHQASSDMCKRFEDLMLFSWIQDAVLSTLISSGLAEVLPAARRSC